MEIGVFDYYPYGKMLREFQDNVSEKYLTTHNQRDEETTLDYRYARFYDSDLGRFLSIDPMAADYASWSGYNYVVGNPIAFVDPTGNSAWIPELNSNGDIRLIKEQGDNLETLKTFLEGSDFTETQINELYDNAFAGVWVTLPESNFSEAFKYAIANKDEFATNLSLIHI